MRDKNPIEFLGHIIENVDLIESQIIGLDFASFVENKTIRNAVVREMEIIGEAVKNLPMDFRKEYLDIPWKSATGMRDTIVHEYFGIDFRVVWETSRENLPTFKKQIKDLLDKLNHK